MERARVRKRSRSKVAAARRAEVLRKRKERTTLCRKQDMSVAKEVGFSANKGGKYHSGTFWSERMGKHFTYRSAYELGYFYLLEADEDIVAYDVEPFSIPYRLKGVQHRYIPDILVTHKDGSRELLEVKPRRMSVMLVNRTKAAAAKAFIKENMPNCTYRFVFEEDIFSSSDIYKKFLKIITGKNKRKRRRK